MSQSPTKATALVKTRAKKKSGLRLPPPELKRRRKAESKLIVEEKKELMVSKEDLRRLREAEAKLVIDDGEPVDNTFSEKQQRLLAQTLYSSWTPPPGDKNLKTKRKFWTAANVGIFTSAYEGGIAPDVFVSLDVEAPKEAIRKAYFLWDCGKFPELVIEIVSNTKGGEISRKHNRYEQMGIRYYVVLDPFRYFKGEVLQVFVLQEGVYQPTTERYFPCLGLGLKLWHGDFEDIKRTYLRWCDRKGKLLPTADERAKRAKLEAERAKREAGRAAKMAAKLRELGIDPEQL
ncbi:MAG: Uma2 family endonuclease [Blastocatellia bacterium]